MRKNNLYLACLLLITTAYAYTQVATSPASNSQDSIVTDASAVLFSSEMPTNSIHEKNIDATYGPTGINLPASDIVNIKKTYCYLEFLVKLNKVKNDKKSQQYAADFKSFLNPIDTKAVLLPTQSLVASKGWQAIKITGEDITNSPAWQVFIKSMISDIFDNDLLFIVDATQANNQLASYIPNIEQGFYNNSFTATRLYEESMRVQALMQSEQKNRYLVELEDWKDFDPTKLIGAVTQFKATDFYKYTHNSQAIEPKKDEKTSDMTMPVVLSPVKEQIICHAMLVQIQLAVQNFISKKNDPTIFNSIGSTSITPHFVTYTQSDYLYCNDLYVLQKLINENNKNPKETTLAMQGMDESLSTTTPASNLTMQAVTPVKSIAPSNPLSIPQGASQEQAATSMFAQLPTTSIYEATLEKIYGKTGLNIAPDQLVNLKKTYCYLEFLVKVNKVRTSQNFNMYQLTDFKDYAHDNMTVVNMPTQTLVTSNAWKSIPVTQEEIIASSAWQNFVKTMICDCTDREIDFITKSADAQNLMFPFLPNIEPVYSTQEFTELRLYLESLQLDAVMQGDQKKKYMLQCADWKNSDPTKMDSIIAEFKKTDFYNYTHNADSAVNPTTKSINFTTAEEIVSYFLLITTQSSLFVMLTSENLAQFLKQANSEKLAPNLMSYTSSDYIYLSDFLSLKKLTDENKAHPIVSTVTISPTTSDNVAIQSMRNKSQETNDSDNDVVIQKISLKKIGKSLKSVSKSASKALDPAKNGLNDSIAKTNKASADALDPSKNGLNDSVAKTNKASADALDPAKNGLNDSIAKTNKASADALDPSKNGLNDSIAKTNKAAANALDPSKNGFDKIVSAPAKAALDPAKNGFNIGMRKVFIAIDSAFIDLAMNLATGMIDMSAGVVFAASSYGKLFNPDINPARQSARVKADMNKHKAAIAAVMAVVFAITVTVLTFGIALIAASILAPILLPAALIVDKRVSDVAMIAMMPIMMPIMQGMEIMNNAFTTGFIEMSVGLTFGAYTYAHAFNPKINVQQEMNRVRAKLETYRSTLNIINSVVISLLMTVAVILLTMGAGAAMSAATTAGMFGQQAATAEVTRQAGILALKEGAKQAAIVAAKQAAAEGAKEGVKQSALMAAKEMAKAAIKTASAIFTSTADDALAAGAKIAVNTVDDTLVVGGKIALNAADDILIAGGKIAANASDDILAIGGKIAVNTVDDGALTISKTAVSGLDDVGTNLIKNSGDDLIRATANVADDGANAVASFGDDAVKTVASAADDLGDDAIATVASAADDSGSIAANVADDAAKTVASAADDLGDDAIATVASAADDSGSIAANVADDGANAVASTADDLGDDAITTLAKNSSDDVANMSADDAAAILKKESERLANRWHYQKLLEDGLWKAIKSATIYDFGFVLGQVFNAGFSVFSAMAAIAQDQFAADQVTQEKESIQSLWKFVEESKINATQSEKMFLDELHKKQQASVVNQAFGLQYYNNFLSGSVANVQTQIAQALAQQYIQLLTPDQNGLRIADIGSSWGLQTPFTYLYPSQGFVSATLGRTDFPYAQEIAQAPLASETQESSTIKDLHDTKAVAEKLWFNQRAISVVNQPVTQPLNVEIKFRLLYTLNTAYHVGLYLGGNYYDYESASYLKSLQDKGTVDINAAHLAKMLVIKRDNAQAIPSVGLYENEGKGWIAEKPLDANTINSSSIYHMSANLNKDALTVSFWSEDNPSAKWTQTTTITPCDQRTFGVIFSGVAVEWGVVQPNQPITQSKTIRTESNGKSEADREKASKAQWAQLLSPKFGTMIIQSPGKLALLQGQYLYTTQSTGLLDGQGKPVTDYIVFGTSTTNVHGTTITNIGGNPTGTATLPASNAIISLISGNVYNSSNKVISHQTNALQIYAQKNNVAQNLMTTITKAGQVYKQQLLNVNFGSYQLTAISTDAIDSGLYMYTCPTTITTAGTPILDYLIMADLMNNSLGSTIGMPPSSNVPGMISLITGNVYNKSSLKPIDGGYSPLTQYTKQYGQLPAAIAAQVAAASNAYAATLASQNQTTPATQTTSVSVVGSQTVSFSDLLPTTAPTTGGYQLGLSAAAPSNMIPTTSSIAQRQSDAAGTASMEVSGFGPIGLNFGTPTPSIAQSATPPATMVTGQTTSLSNVPVHAVTQTQQNITKIQDVVSVPAPSVPTPSSTPTVSTQQPSQQTVTASPLPAISNDQFVLVGSSGFSF